MASSEKTINLHPYHCEQEGTSSGFVLSMYGRTEGGNTVKVRLHFDFWWVGFLARELWKAIAYRRTEVARAESEMEKKQ